MPPDASPLSHYGFLIPIAVAAVIILLRNSRPRRLKIESLWLVPVIYLVFLALALYAAPPPLTLMSLAILAGALLIGAAIGWQRGRFTRIDIHPETHDLTSRASPIGLIFIFAIILVRYAARDFLAGNASSLHLPVIAVADGFVVLVVAMLSVQRLEVWMRASKILAEARDAKGPPAPPSLVS